MDRREFIKKASIFSSVVAVDAFSAVRKDRYHFVMPKKPFEYYIKEGKQKGGKVLIIGGIHGNEEGGYKASDILIDTEVKKGILAILPRSNPESIFTDKRGYNGDMNRKFSYLSPRDKDFYKIKSIKNFIADFKPDVVLSLHDGYGFYARHHNHWGECIVIDENHYKGIDLYNPAKFVSDNLKKLGFNIPINNTKTFHKTTHHLEQRKSLTYYILEKHHIPAFCIEASKQTNIKKKLQVHLNAIKYFLQMYDVEISPSFDYILLNLDKYIIPKPTKVVMHINNNKIILSKPQILTIPKNTEIKFEIANNRAGGLIAQGVNVNYKSFFYKHNIKFLVKNDALTEYSFIIKG